MYVVQYSKVMGQAMDQLKIEGGACLGGTLEASGAKNAALSEMRAAFLAPIRFDLENATDLQMYRPWRACWPTWARASRA